MNLWVESGATKAEWLLEENGHIVKQLQTAGIRIGHTKESELRSILNEAFHVFSSSGIEKMYFFGSGCLKLERQQLMHAYLSSSFGNAIHIQVRSDLEAAALACKHNKSGFVGILGTGSVAFYWNGGSIEQVVGGKGFPQGDEGGGADLGKRLLQQLIAESHPLRIKLERLIGNLDTFYEKALSAENSAKEMAKLSYFIAEHREEALVRQLLENAFMAFFDQVNTLSPTTERVIDLVGSIAVVFLPELQKVATEAGWKIGVVVPSPLKKLITLQ